MPRKTSAMYSCPTCLDTELKIVLSTVFDRLADVLGVSRLHYSVTMTFDGAIVDGGCGFEAIQYQTPILSTLDLFFGSRSRYLRRVLPSNHNGSGVRQNFPQSGNNLFTLVGRRERLFRSKRIRLDD